MTTFRRNIVANYASQAYVTLLGIGVMPLYLRYMGAEAYGLVGFFTMLLAWFYLLDLGLTPTIARETARFRGGAIGALSYRRLMRALQLIFFGIAIGGGGILFALAGVIARDWLNVNALPAEEVRFAVQMIALGLAFRWMAGLYRGAVAGSEMLVWLARYGSVIATLRFIGVLPVLMLVSKTPTAFFTYQLVVSMIEVAGLAVKNHRLLPPVPLGDRLGWSFAPIRPVLKFSLTIALTSSVWILVTQTDKLVLSRLLPLAEYGYFMLAVLVASAILLSTVPVSNALLPRLARLEAEGDHAALIRLYREATELVCVIGLPVACALAAFPQHVIMIWTGDSVAAVSAAPILRLYALGNGVLLAAGFPFYLQYAKGDLRLHLIGSVIFLTLLIPTVIWATLSFGGVGAGWAWLVTVLIYFFGWTPVVHRRLEPGLHWRWLWRDVGVYAGLAAITAGSLAVAFDPPESRVGGLLFLLLAGMLILTVTAMASRVGRARASELIGWIRRGRLEWPRGSEL